NFSIFLRIRFFASSVGGTGVGLFMVWKSPETRASWSLLANAQGTRSFPRTRFDHRRRGCVLADRRENPLEQRSWRGRATRNLDVDGNHVGHASERCIALAEDTAGATAIAHGDDELRLGRRVVRALH